MMDMDHQRNYRMALPLGALFALAGIAASVVFVVYAAEWADKSDTEITFTNREQTNRFIQAEYSYYATVIALLTLVIFFNGYHLTKM